MNLSPLTNQILLGLSSMCLMSTVQARIPVWSFSPIGSPVVSVSATGTAVVKYTITNNSKKPHRLALSSKTPAGISQSGGPCVLVGKSPANPSPSCTLTLSINGSALPANNLSGGPSLCQTNPNGTPNANQCYQPDSNDVLVITRTTAPGATTLSTSVSPPSILALSVNNRELNPALTGNARQITIKNTGANDASGLTIAYPGWPGGTPATTASSTCGSTLTAGATCTITVTPGANPTSDCNTGIAPTPGTITVSATNVATPATSNVVVLGYGCQYQGGFLYSVNDTTNNGVTGTCTIPPCTGSIGGKVAATSDQAAAYPNGVIWSSNGASGSSNFSLDTIPGIDQTSTSPSNQSPDYNAFSNMFDYSINPNGTYTNAAPTPALAFATCDGSTNGYCNTQNVALFYNKYMTHYSATCDPQTESGSGGCTAMEPTQPATSLAFYAAGLCTNYTNGGFTAWYLPAICEMGPDSGNSICSTANVEQNMVDNLSFLLSNTVPCTTPSGCLAGVYWSSTESSGFPQILAWLQFFASSDSLQATVNKSAQLGVRCSRALTI